MSKAKKSVLCRSKRGSALLGSACAPGDKSISHRSLILGALASGVTTITGLLEGADIMATARAMRGFGAKVTKTGEGAWSVEGLGARGLKQPKNDIDCGNAGTGVRLIMGAASAYPISARYIGDVSLSSRPMGRVVEPLREMGVTAIGAQGDRLPMNVTGPKALTALRYSPPHASAQVKSAILLAGLGASGVTEVNEATRTRDHTENMLRAFGCPVESVARGEGASVRLTGPASLTATHVNVPGDPSSAAFLIAAALIVPGSDITIENVMMNPSRTGLFETLVEMGADILTDNFKTSGGEIIADLRVRHSKLRGIVVPPRRAPSMIDEYPILAVVAAFARGQTVMDGIGELRVKESDRIAASVALLRAGGVEVSQTDTSMTVSGANSAAGGGHVITHHDHRIAMSALILGLATDAPMSIDDSAMIATSFPQFFDMMRGLGADISGDADISGEAG
ncbi:MAG: 3-phosphoshikimate 1-carboxyvinyltransferase [Robiginitomaculum sp.]